MAALTRIARLGLQRQASITRVSAPPLEAHSLLLDGGTKSMTLDMTVVNF